MRWVLPSVFDSKLYFFELNTFVFLLVSNVIKVSPTGKTGQRRGWKSNIMSSSYQEKVIICLTWKKWNVLREYSRQQHRITYTWCSMWAFLKLSTLLSVVYCPYSKEPVFCLYSKKQYTKDLKEKKEECLPSNRGQTLGIWNPCRLYTDPWCS